MKRIKELREKAGFTQDELANKLHVSQQCISSWENGTREPSLEQIKELATIFCCSIDMLLGITYMLDLFDEANNVEGKEKKDEAINKVTIIKSSNSKCIKINGVEIPEVRGFFIANNSEKATAPSRLVLEFDISNFHIDVQFQEDFEV